MKFFNLLIIALITFSCSNDSDEQPQPVIINTNSPELFTKVELLLEKNGVVFTLVVEDTNNDGQLETVDSSILLEDNSTYNCNLKFYNGSTEITNEIINEGIDHQAFFEPTYGITTSYLNFDSDGKPIGTEFEMTTNLTMTGVSIAFYFNVTLKHKPNKSGVNVSSGNIENAEGVTEVNSNFGLITIFDN